MKITALILALVMVITAFAACAGTAKSLGTELFWISYHQSSGYEDWSSYDFSVAVMQPNYVFRAETEYDLLLKSIELIKYFEWV